MLAQSAVRGFGGKAKFVAENYGDSELAKRFGVTRYPAFFVDDILVATPNDFGFYASGAPEQGGRYAPLKSAEAHQRFRGDLSRMIELLLAGKRREASAIARPAAPPEVGAYPEVTITALDGKPLTKQDLAGRVVLVELWATWCPPCKGTLGWLSALAQKEERIRVVALAVESNEAEVKQVAGRHQGPIFALGTPEVVRAFGDVSAVPTLLLFDGSGRSRGVFFGAPPTLERDVEAQVEALLGAR